MHLLFIAERIPSLGYRTYRVQSAESSPEYKTGLTADASALENDFFKVSLNPQTGWIRSLYDKRTGREMLAGEGNVLQASVDEPPNMSAWELGLKDTAWNIGAQGATIEVIERGPVRAVLRVKNAFRNSLFVQDIRLYHQVPRVDCRLRLDWQERNLLVKAAFPAAVKNTSAVFEIPYGAIPRPADGTEGPATREGGKKPRRSAGAMSSTARSWPAPEWSIPADGRPISPSSASNPGTLFCPPSRRNRGTSTGAPSSASMRSPERNPKSRPASPVRSRSW